MKFSINRDVLFTNLNNISKALSTKAPMPVLTGIKIDVKKNYITLTASNSEISIQAKIDDPRNLFIEEVGTIVIPGKYFIEIVRKVEAKTIDIHTFENNMVKILADRSNFTLNLLEKENYPLISFDESNLKISLDALNLKQIIRKTTFATSLSESRMILMGVSFSIDKHKLEAIATDSFRLAKKYIVFDHENPSVNVVIPSKSLDELIKILDDNDEIVDIHFGKSKVLFKYKNLLFQTRLIDGVYPNTNSLIPQDFLVSIKFNKNELISSIERAALFTSLEVANIIKLNLKNDKIVEISSVSNEIGAVLEEIYPLECSNNIPFQIAFSAKYFLDAVKAFDSNEVTIHFTGEIKPFIITGEFDANLVQLILPVRVS